MKKQVVKKSFSQFQSCQLSNDQILKLKGGSGNSTTDIVIIDVITS